MIIVIDYDVGNVKSVCNAFRYIGCQAKLSCDAVDIKSAAGLVLPGVAAFGYAMKALGDTAGLIKEFTASGRPLLGICVGYQLLFDQSCEHGNHKGLGLIKGNVIGLPQGRVIPHMGWNEVQMSGEIDIFEGLPEKKHFYFAHSYYSDILDKEATIACTDYGFALPAAVRKKNVYGTQFHPEKSGPNGLNILENFSRIAEEASKC
ncbi:MAG: imidazole glycerol phosphate synthase subunit HisH [Planctomycetota bacterium]|jgi:glutamine amidotransferase